MRSATTPGRNGRGELVVSSWLLVVAVVAEAADIAADSDCHHLPALITIQIGRAHV